MEVLRMMTVSLPMFAVSVFANLLIMPVLYSPLDLNSPPIYPPSSKRIHMTCQSSPQLPTLKNSLPSSTTQVSDIAIPTPAPSSSSLPTAPTHSSSDDTGSPESHNASGLDLSTLGLKAEVLNAIMLKDFEVASDRLTGSDGVVLNDDMPRFVPEPVLDKGRGGDLGDPNVKCFRP
jgi:hypothetical protein